MNLNEVSAMLEAKLEASKAVSTKGKQTAKQGELIGRTSGAGWVDASYLQDKKNGRWITWIVPPNGRSADGMKPEKVLSILKLSESERAELIALCENSIAVGESKAKQPAKTAQAVDANATYLAMVQQAMAIADPQERLQMMDMLSKLMPS